MIDWITVSRGHLREACPLAMAAGLPAAATGLKEIAACPPETSIVDGT